MLAAILIWAGGFGAPATAYSVGAPMSLVRLRGIRLMVSCCALPSTRMLDRTKRICQPVTQAAECSYLMESLTDGNLQELISLLMDHLARHPAERIHSMRRCSIPAVFSCKTIKATG